jgi:hypothetical protein
MKIKSKEKIRIWISIWICLMILNLDCDPKSFKQERPPKKVFSKVEICKFLEFKIFSFSFSLFLPFSSLPATSQKLHFSTYFNFLNLSEPIKKIIEANG